jgi:hypothetical protein
MQLVRAVLLYLVPSDHACRPAAPYGLELLASSIADLDVEVTIANPYLRADPIAAVDTLLGDARDVGIVGLGLRNLDNLAHVWNARARAVNGVHSTSFVGAVRPVVERVRALVGDRIVLGGGGFSAAPEECLAFFDASLGVIGPGEETFRALVDAALAGESPLARARRDVDELPGVIVRTSDGRLVRSRRRSGLRGMGPVLPAPFDTWSSGSATAAELEVAVRIADGCNAHCTFCVERQTPVTLRPFADIVDELDQVAARGHRNVFLASSELNVGGESWVVDLCSAIRAAGLHRRLTFRSYVCPVPASRRLLDALVEAAFDTRATSFTVTHVDDEMLRRLGRRHRQADLSRLADDVVAAGFGKLSFGVLFGAPGESWDTLRRSVDTIGELAARVGPRLHVRYNCGVRIYPHTPLATLARKRGPSLPLYGFEDPTFLQPVVASEPLAPAELATWLEEAFAPLGADVRRFNHPGGESSFGAALAEEAPEVVTMLKTAARLEPGDRRATELLRSVAGDAHTSDVKLSALEILARRYSREGRLDEAVASYEAIVGLLSADERPSTSVRKAAVEAHGALAALAILRGDPFTSMAHQSAASSLEGEHVASEAAVDAESV